jgi:hypothetical protein
VCHDCFTFTSKARIPLTPPSNAHSFNLTQFMDSKTPHVPVPTHATPQSRTHTLEKKERKETKFKEEKRGGEGGSDENLSLPLLALALVFIVLEMCALLVLFRCLLIQFVPALALAELVFAALVAHFLGCVLVKVALLAALV